MRTNHGIPRWRRSATSSAGSASSPTCPCASWPRETRLSNPYLSQVERGLHQPSMRVIKLISEALNVSAETLLTHAGLLHHGDGETSGEAAAVPAVEQAIQADGRLSDQQKAALVSVYRSMLGAD